MECLLSHPAPGLHGKKDLHYDSLTDDSSASKIYTVIWQPPPFSWIKVNTDGASKGNPRPASCGAVFRDFQGNFCGGFSMNLGSQDALFAELTAIIVAVECSKRKGWNHLWLESDCKCALSYICDESFDPPSSLKCKWLHLKSTLKTMSLLSSHIFREGNAAADFLANVGQSCFSFTWWDRPPHADLQTLLLQDKYGMPKYRVR